jgi:hypothetical protein
MDLGVRLGLLLDGHVGGWAHDPIEHEAISLTLLFVGLLL